MKIKRLVVFPFIGLIALFFSSAAFSNVVFIEGLACEGMYKGLPICKISSVRNYALDVANQDCTNMSYVFVFHPWRAGTCITSLQALTNLDKYDNGGSLVPSCPSGTVPDPSRNCKPVITCWDGSTAPSQSSCPQHPICGSSTSDDSSGMCCEPNSPSTDPLTGACSAGDCPAGQHEGDLTLPGSQCVPDVETTQPSFTCWDGSVAVGPGACPPSSDGNHLCADDEILSSTATGYECIKITCPANGGIENHICHECPNGGFWSAIDPSNPTVKGCVHGGVANPEPGSDTTTGSGDTTGGGTTGGDTTTGGGDTIGSDTTGGGTTGGGTTGGGTTSGGTIGSTTGGTTDGGTTGDGTTTGGDITGGDAAGGDAAGGDVAGGDAAGGDVAGGGDTGSGDFPSGGFTFNPDCSLGGLCVSTIADTNQRIKDSFLPISNIYDSLSSVESSGQDCPIFEIKTTDNFFGDISTDAHCTVINAIRSPLTSVLQLCYSIYGLFILLKA